MLNKTVIKSALKIYAATILSALLADGADVVSVQWGDIRVWAAAALASALPLIISALDSSDDRFGRNSNSEGAGDDGGDIETD